VKFLRGIFLDNLTLKGISLIFAFLLWVQIAGQQRVQRSVPVPLEFINMPTGLVLTNDYPRQINVLISKPSSVRMDERQLAAVLDLRGAKAGPPMVFPLTEQTIRNVPSGVQIVGIEQRRIQLQFERLRRKIVRIEPRIVGQPAQGFEVGGVRVSPSEVLISGPESQLESVSVAETEPIDVNGRNRGFMQTVYLNLEDNTLRIENTASVDVYVAIEEERRDIAMRLPVQILPKEPRLRVTPRNVEVVLSVPISYPGELNKEGFYALVSIPDNAFSETDSVQLAPSVVVPDEYQEVVRVESVTPSEVKVAR